ncbi:HAD family hydrolase [Chlorogloeopsis fritschii PCC 9212]|uniref:Haloacid dehalogenase n=1 Tax=Chlorogloeopsis fritschii PCC 6912 TaxID=211165 RepID=A0A3S0XTM3_CHLFR|nr:HAD family hydrolase [Chlorogloeopsis fritschii]RUR77447.1 haloacid dehalogenase [Chlorogloeopsis fritschii PCC 6912]
MSGAPKPVFVDPLPSWNEGTTKATILDFVRRVTIEDSSDYVPPSERIATFDNDGTLWCEQPTFVQGFFLLDRVKTITTEQPELAEQQPFKAVLENDKTTLATFGKKELVALVFATHTGMTPEEFRTIVQTWFDSAMHPRFHRLFRECVYQPQLELLDYLRANGFKTFIVTGGGSGVVRTVAESIYGIPPEQVIGSSSKTTLEWRDGKPVLVKQPELNSFDDRAEKVVNIELHIGRRPILAFGNSDGDLAMLQYTAAGTGARLALLLHHDDSDREYAYDRDFHFSPLREALEEVPKLNGGHIVSMRQDFKQVFPFS